MPQGNELWNAVQLLLLLCLLFWSMTWNSPADMGSSSKFHSKRDFSPKSEKNTPEAQISLSMSQRSVSEENFAYFSYKPKKNIVLSPGGKFIPPFNEWKEKEMKKEESRSNQKAVHYHHNLKRRKLNYSSSKCGAKILASNQETKHRAAILNENVDEYLLCPCRIRTWFVIEMCDTVEAKQIELANYELYSSSPKRFSVFWSDSFPTQTWHHLGSFEAEDKRTMQAFELNKRNLGKFIKVIIYSHHGKEHFCPLSVFRVLGYSMVHEFEEMEDKKNPSQYSALPNLVTGNYSQVKSDENKSFTGANTSFLNLPKETAPFFQDPVTQFLKNENAFPLLQKYCFNLSSTTHHCLNQPSCFFLKHVLKYPKQHFRSDIHSEQNKTDFSQPKSLRGTEKEILKPFAVKKIVKELQSENTCHKTLRHPMFNLKTLCKSSDMKVIKQHDSKKKSKVPYISSKKNHALNFDDQSAKNATSENATQLLGNALNSSENVPKLCPCKTTGAAASYNEYVFGKTDDDPKEFESSEDTAGLMQKDSVLVRLTSRIRESEANLSLINRYLQHLSQSYGKQMEDMKLMFNQTVKAINKASEKAEAINNDQEKCITELERGITRLDRKLNYIIDDQKTIIKQVFELHGFFLILECIIITTIFTITVNSFRRKSSSLMEMNAHSRRHFLWKTEALYFKNNCNKL